MWLFTSIGFFSVVQKPGTDYLTVRSRVASDLEQLRERYMPELSATIEGVGSDYPFRATISHKDFAQGLAQVALDINYGNFKDEVARQMGDDRADIYGKVWATLLQWGWNLK